MNRMAADRGHPHRLQRVARRIAEQHHVIDECYSALAEKIGEHTARELRAEFGCYRLALTAQFELEERVFFPAVRRGDASQRARIRQLLADHSRLRAELAHLADSIESIPVDDFSRRLAAFTSILTLHECQEEAFLNSAAGSALTNHESRCPTRAAHPINRPKDKERRE